MDQIKKASGVKFALDPALEPLRKYESDLMEKDPLLKALEKPKVKAEEAAATQQTNRFFDPHEIAKTLRQFEAVRGRTVAPGAVEEAVSGAIQAQIAPGVARTEARTEAEKGRAFERGVRARQEENRRREARISGGATIGTAIGTVAGAYFGGPAGATAGGTVGGVAGGALAENSVICTELNRQGYLSKRELAYTYKFREKHLSDDEYYGYLMWATPLVGLMKESKLLTYIVSLVWMPITKQSISMVSSRKGSLLGKLLLGCTRKVSKLIYRRSSWRLVQA
jgi:uncharacterized protein YcfJ